MSRIAVPVTAPATVVFAFQSVPSCPVWCAEMPVGRIHVDSSLVLIPVHVTDAVGNTVIGMHRGDFRVFEDNVEQHVTTFSLEDAPVSVGILFDASGSMRNYIRESAEAVGAFLGTADADDEFFLVEFSEKAKLTVPFTPDPDEIFQQVRHTKAFGRTSLLDAIHLALVELKGSRNPRKAIVILSDGGDNRSRLSRGQIRDAILESDVQLYAIGIFRQDNPKELTPEERGGRKLLDELAGCSGGHLHTVGSLEQLGRIGTQVGNELHSKYPSRLQPHESGARREVPACHR